MGAGQRAGGCGRRLRPHFGPRTTEDNAARRSAAAGPAWGAGRAPIGQPCSRGPEPQARHAGTATQVRPQLIRPGALPDAGHRLGREPAPWPPQSRRRRGQWIRPWPARIALASRAWGVPQVLAQRPDQRGWLAALAGGDNCQGRVQDGVTGGARSRTTTWAAWLAPCSRTGAPWSSRPAPGGSRRLARHRRQPLASSVTKSRRSSARSMSVTLPSSVVATGGPLGPVHSLTIMVATAKNSAMTP